ncbi:hypothetical protein MACH16_11160 [Marinomonas pontica]|uniref:GTP-binding protein n=1 Tax=Marinomonas pontica TaxID=264739 RepID=A0ABM8FBA4_9GAMM|nr:hypothetical protein MACH16_11160 [Marinomonas pontica]
MRYQGIKVTLVTGFLGAGKTTLIRQILAQAPLNERWAVLVNEFGDIGLDSAFYADLGVAISDVPGGCVCCTTSAAFQQGLNQLIRRYNPDRIFIEPSGLGHPKQIIQKLRSAEYHDVLLLSGVFCVLDARSLQDERYTQHALFKDQIESADGLVLSHVDQYSSRDVGVLELYLEALSLSEKTPALFTSSPLAMTASKLTDSGLTVSELTTLELDVRLASSPLTEFSTVTQPHAGPLFGESNLIEKEQIPPSIQPVSLNIIGRWHYQKKQDAMQVLGWHWPVGEDFDADKVLFVMQNIMMEMGVYRVKGVFAVTASEAVFVNAARGEITSTLSAWHQPSRMEIIGDAEGVWSDRVRKYSAELL